MSFKKNKYCVIRKVLSKEVLKISFDYLNLKKQACKILKDSGYFSPLEEIYGTWGDPQVKDTYSVYGDVLMDTILQNNMKLVERKTKLKLQPNYSYARIYKKGDILERHKDRSSCEISTTMSLGGDDWPIYLEPSGKEGMKGIKVDLKPGDMLVYSGCELEHWRNKFKKNSCTQVFLHYNIKNTNKELFDGRGKLGLPSWFKR